MTVIFFGGVIHNFSWFHGNNLMETCYLAPVVMQWLFHSDEQVVASWSLVNVALTLIG